MIGQDLRRPRAQSAPALTLGSELTYLQGAGPQAASALRGLDLHTVGDLLFHLPLRYEDRRRLTPLADLREGAEALVRWERPGVGLVGLQRGTDLDPVGSALQHVNTKPSLKTADTP